MYSGVAFDNVYLVTLVKIFHVCSVQYIEILVIVIHNETAVTS